MWIMLSSSKMDFSQSPSLATKVATIYSASLEDNATIDCFYVFQVMAPPLNVKRYLDVDREVSLSPPQSASMEPCRGATIPPLEKAGKAL